MWNHPLCGSTSFFIPMARRFLQSAVRQSPYSGPKDRNGLGQFILRLSCRKLLRLPAKRTQPSTSLWDKITALVGTTVTVLVVSEADRIENLKVPTLCVLEKRHHFISGYMKVKKERLSNPFLGSSAILLVDLFCGRPFAESLQVYRAALMAAMAPSDTAVATWRTCLTRMSPAAYTPGMEASIFSLVTI